MPLPAKLSVYVIAYNDESNMRACLESVAGWGDELIQSQNLIFCLEKGNGITLVTMHQRERGKVQTAHR